jgi:hypothetical protein
LPLGALGSQEAPTLSLGARVRVVGPLVDPTRPWGRRLSAVGLLESIDSARIVVRDEDSAAVAVPRGPDTQLFVSGGPGMCSGERRGSCVAVGLLGGIGLGVLAGALASSGQGCVDQPCELAFLLTVPAGALVGTILGARVGGEHWIRVGEPLRVSLGRDGSRGITVGVSIRF